MGKLFGQIFKEDIKTIILWMFLPLAAVTIFSQLIRVFESSLLVGIGLVLSGILLVAGPLIGIAVLTKNDNQRFYGDNASFYSALPFSSAEVTGARYINYILIGLIIAISIVLNFILLTITQSNAPLSFAELFGEISELLSKIDIRIFWGVILNFFMLGLSFASMIMFANTAGHLKILGVSKSASAIIFAIIFIIIGYLFAKVQGWIIADYMTTVNSGEFSLEVANNAPVMKTVILPALFNIFVAAILYILTLKIHKDKLSVA